MKILHTSDWHLGKRLEGRSRIPEQEQALCELEHTAREVGADAIVVAGDVFDTVNPPAEAESLFYSACLSLSKICPVIAIAGNHDNPERISAPNGIAAECGIVLGGNLDFAAVRKPFEGGEGFVRLTRGAERVNFALLPYPSRSRMSALGYESSGESYAQNVREWLNICAKGFTSTDCNITVSHLFMENSKRSGDEIELGTAAILPSSILPDAAYTALGHVHRPQCVDKRRSAYYSGSLLRYSFDDDSDKFFNLVETSPVGATVTRIPIKGGRRLVTETVRSYAQCIEVLERSEGCYVRLLYDCPDPLSASKFAELRGYDCYAALSNVYAIPASVRREQKFMTDSELFAAFYKEFTKGEEPSAAMIEIFEKAMRGEEL